MDPNTLTTGMLDAAGQVASGALDLAVRLKAPTAVVGGLTLLVLALWGLKALRGARSEPAPPPTSDGGSADDEARRAQNPARPGPPVPLDEPGRGEG